MKEINETDAFCILFYQYNVQAGILYYLLSKHAQSQQ